MVKDSLGLDSRVLNGLVKYGLYFRVSEEVLRRLGGNWHSILYFFHRKQTGSDNGGRVVS